MSLSNRRDTKYANRLQKDAQLLQFKITAAQTAIRKANEEIKMYTHLAALRKITYEDLFSNANLRFRTHCFKLYPKHNEDMLHYATHIAKATTRKNYAAYDLKIAKSELKILESLALEYDIDLKAPVKLAIPKQAGKQPSFAANLSMFSKSCTYTRQIKQLKEIRQSEDGEAVTTLLAHPEQRRK